MSLSAVEIYLAPLVLQDEMGNSLEGQERPESDLLKAFTSRIQGESLVVKAADIGFEETPKSFLDAARLSEAHGYPYLLYGYLKKSEYSFSAEVKLIERERKEVVSVFFAGDDRGHYERLMDDLAGKITEYFFKDVGVKVQEKGSEPERNLISFPASLGYWTPTGQDWGRVLVGLAAVHGGVRFIPVKNPKLYFSLGAELEYDIGMNQVLYESFVLHTLKFRLPVEGVFDLGKGVSFGLWIGPLFQMDIMAQTVLYADPFTGLTAVMGLSTGIILRFAVSDRIAIGVNNLFDAAVYQPALIEYSPRVFVEFTLGPQGDGR